MEEAAFMTYTAARHQGANVFFDFLITLLFAQKQPNYFDKVTVEVMIKLDLVTGRFYKAVNSIRNRR